MRRPTTTTTAELGGRHYERGEARQGKGKV
jgi:hypothetical protein